MAIQLTLPLHRTYRVPAGTYTLPTDSTLFVSLEDAGLEESHDDEPAHGIFHCNEGSIYSYTYWFYDGDESAFSII